MLYFISIDHIGFCSEDKAQGSDDTDYGGHHEGRAQTSCSSTRRIRNCTDYQRSPGAPERVLDEYTQARGKAPAAGGTISR